jgi:small multidrug resistance pump
VGFLVGASLAFAVGGALMTWSDGFRRLWPSLGVVVLFVLGAFLLAQVVRTTGLSTAYALGLGLEAIVSVGIGMYVFGERMTPVKAVGVVLILAGVASVRLG